jgi:dihydrofolate synthase/folylpolyglutamate synthase
MEQKKPPAPPSARLASALARLDTLVNWERRSRERGMRQDLAPMRDLLERMGLEKRDSRAVHVTGTKGKGTVTTLVAEGLRRAGWKVGSYTSPHVERMNERIAIDGRPVGDELLAGSLVAALTAREAALAEATAARDASWFDVVTAAAFHVFASEGVEWACVEVGIGGRLDSTNVVHGEVCVVTTVDLEHTSVLGTTRAAIAREKGGILKTGSSLVCGVRPDPGRGADDDAGSVLVEMARALGDPVRLLPSPVPESIGAFDRALAELALDELGRRGERSRGDKPIGPGLLAGVRREDLLLPGRLERASYRGVPVVLDGAHVAFSVPLVLAELRTDPALRSVPIAILALGSDKDAGAFLKALRPATDTVACTFVEGSLHRRPAELCALARGAGFVAEAMPSPAAALDWAVERAEGRWVLAIGSLHLAGALRPLVTRNRDADARL